MTEMVERVARAIAKEIGSSFVHYDHREMARAAIAAMREPTDHMLMASGPHRTQKAKWQAMIDEALKL